MCPKLRKFHDKHFVENVTLEVNLGNSPWAIHAAIPINVSFEYTI